MPLGCDLSSVYLKQTRSRHGREEIQGESEMEWYFIFSASSSSSSFFFFFFLFLFFYFSDVGLRARPS